MVLCPHNRWQLSVSASHHTHRCILFHAGPAGEASCFTDEASVWSPWGSATATADWRKTPEGPVPLFSGPMSPRVRTITVRD
jgi:hypothetical protein